MDQFPWDTLLRQLRGQRVIPIIGRELQVLDSGITLEEHVAARVLDNYGVEPAACGLTPDLDRAVMAAVAESKEPVVEVLGFAQQEFIDATALGVPEPLAKLAEMTSLRLFVTVTPDTLLEKALRTRRLGGVNPSVHWFCTSARIRDLPDDFEDLEQPAVFHLFGFAGTRERPHAGDFAGTAEDTLEFLYRLQDPEKRPENLFAALSSMDVLFLGCGFPDWLSRFFVRIVTNHRLSDTGRRKLEFIVDNQFHRAEPNGASGNDLTVFLTEHRASLFEGTVIDFVDELHRRWLGQASASELAARELVDSDEDRKMPDASIFVSYAREDREVAADTRRMLSDKNLRTWMDERSLEVGDAWEAAIHDNIRRCILFIALVSRKAANDPDRYVRTEWDLAAAEARARDGQPFLIPVYVDDLRPEEVSLPPEFHAANAAFLSSGRVGDELIAAIIRKVKDIQLRDRGLAIGFHAGGR